MSLASSSVLMTPYLCPLSNADKAASSNSAVFIKLSYKSLLIIFGVLSAFFLEIIVPPIPLKSVLVPSVWEVVVSAIVHAYPLSLWIVASA